MKLREFSFEERAHIVSLARTCVKNLSSQPLIDYFNKVYRTKFENNGNMIADTIINKYYPDCNETMRNNLHEIMLQFVFDFEAVLEQGEKDEKRREEESKKDYNDDVYIPEELRGDVEMYIKDDGEVAIRPTYKERLRKVFRDFFIYHNDANKITSSVDTYFDEWYSARIDEEFELVSKKPEKILEQTKLRKKECKSSDSPDGKHHPMAYSCDPSEGYCCKFCGIQL